MHPSVGPSPDTAAPSGAPAGDLTDLQGLLRARVRGDGRSQERIAEAAGIGRTTLHHCLKDLNRLAALRRSTLEALLRELGLDPGERASAWELVTRSRTATAAVLRPREPATRAAESWLMIGPEGPDHFRRRALGRPGGRPDEDLFRGRAAALAKARTWMTDPDPPGVPLVVTGQPGAGKSAVVARTVWMTLKEAGHGPGLALHARGATHHDVLGALGRLAGMPDTPTLGDVLDELERRGAAGDGVTWLIAVDALDEAGTDIYDLARTLRDVAALDAVRMIVATRRRDAAATGGSRPGTLLGELAAAGDSLMDLDDDVYFERSGLVDYVRELLRRRGPRGRAWLTYRDDPTLCDALADVIADRAGRNHLVALMAADSLHDGLAAVDPRDQGFDPEQIPSTVGNALEGYLHSLGPERGHQRRGVLTALAYARGDGLDDRLWRRFATALGYPTSQAELDELRRSTAADYLLQTSWSADGGRTVVRLFHQALVDQLRRDRDRTADECALVETIRPSAPGAPPVTSAYVRTFLAEHAAAAGLLPEILADPGYVGEADLLRLQPFLRDSGLRSNAVATVLRRSAGRAVGLAPGRRAQLFALAAHSLGYPDLATLYDGLSCPVRMRWASGGTVDDEQEELLGHTHGVLALSFGRLADGRDVLATTGHDGVLLLWDLTTGGGTRTVTRHTSSLFSAAFGRLADGRDVLATGDGVGRVQLWDPVAGTKLDDVVLHDDHVTSLAFGRLADGLDVIATGSEDGTARVWAPATDDRRTVWSGPGEVNDVALGRRSDGQDLLATAAEGEPVRLWDPVTGAQLLSLSTTRESAYGVAFCRLAGDDILATADGSVQLWDTTNGDELGSLTDEQDGMFAVATGVPADGRPLLATVSNDSPVQLWDPVSGVRLRSFGDDLGGANAAAIGRLADGHTLLATGMIDCTVRVWDCSDTREPDELGAGRTELGPMRTVRCGGRDLLAVVGGGSVQLWDPATGVREGAVPSRATGGRGPVAFGRFGDGQDVIAVAGARGRIEIWDPATRRRLRTMTGPRDQGLRITLHRLADGRDRLLTHSYRGPTRLWDPATGDRLRTVLDAPSRVSGVAFARLVDDTDVLALMTNGSLWVGDAATGTERWSSTDVGAGNVLRIGSLADGRTILATGGRDGEIHLWDAVTGTRYPSLPGSSHTVTAVEFARLRSGRDVLAVGGYWGEVHLWDAATGVELGSLTGHTGQVGQLAFGTLSSGRDLLATGGEDATVRVWDPVTLDEVFVISLLVPAGSVAFVGDDIALTSGDGLFVFTLATPPPTAP